MNEREVGRLLASAVICVPANLGLLSRDERLHASHWRLLAYIWSTVNKKGWIGLTPKSLAAKMGWKPFALYRARAVLLDAGLVSIDDSTNSMRCLSPRSPWMRTPEGKYQVIPNATSITRVDSDSGRQEEDADEGSDPAGD